MDITYTDQNWRDIGVLDFESLDLAFGDDENEFDLQVDIEGIKLQQGCLVYVDGTEYGGIVDQISVSTERGVVTYHGRTWQGVLERKIISPATGQDYYTVSGDANAVLKQIITKIGLSDLFDVATTASGIHISYQFHRYIEAYTGIRKMLVAHGAKLQIKKRNKVTIRAVGIHDYSKAGEFDDDLIDFTSRDNLRPVNHLVCLGAGELKKRTVIHLYADEDGNVSTTQTLFGAQQVDEKYDYSNAEYSELLQAGKERLNEMQNDSEIDIVIEEGDYDIDDIIAVRNNYAGTVVRAHIIKKILRYEDEPFVEYKAGVTVGALNAIAESNITTGGSRNYIGTEEPQGSFLTGDTWYDPSAQTKYYWKDE